MLVLCDLECGMVPTTPVPRRCHLTGVLFHAGVSVISVIYERFDAGTGRESPKLGRRLTRGGDSNKKKKGGESSKSSSALKPPKLQSW